MPAAGWLLPAAGGMFSEVVAVIHKTYCYDKLEYTDDATKPERLQQEYLVNVLESYKQIHILITTGSKGNVD